MGLFGKRFGQIAKPSGKSSIFYSARLITFARSRELGYLTKVYSSLLQAARRFGGDVYLSDGLFAWGRVIGWIRDNKFLESVDCAGPNHDSGVDSAIAWRTHVACWASSQACKVGGDFFEFGCYEGYTASVIRHFLGDGFRKFDQRSYFWFDLFADGAGGDQKTNPLDQSKSEIMALMRAKKFDDVSVIKGDLFPLILKMLILVLGKLPLLILI